jgi:hypothetical protein
MLTRSAVRSPHRGTAIALVATTALAFGFTMFRLATSHDESAGWRRVSEVPSFDCVQTQAPR